MISKSVIKYIGETISDPQQLEEILESLLIPAKEYYLRVNLSKIPLETFKRELTKEYEAEILEKISYGPLENMVQFSVSSGQDLSERKKKVYCDKFAAEAVRIGADLFVPGVTKIPNSLKEEDKCSVYLDFNNNKFLIEKVRRDIESDGEMGNIELEDLPRKFRRHFHIANGIVKISTKEISQKKHGIFILNNNPKYFIPKYRDTPLYYDGYISDQNLPPNIAMAILSEKILDKKPEDIPIEQYNPVIYDTCAAPGHKTTALTEWLYFKTKKRFDCEKWFEIRAIDRSSNRLRHLENDITRLGLKNITVDPTNLADIKDTEPELLNMADFIMFDPPCSALGQRPKLFIEENEKSLRDYHKNQRRLLKIVDSLLKKNGFLMYNTCTIPKEENEGTVEYAVRKLHYELQSIGENFKRYGEPGIKYKSIQRNDQIQKLLRFYPSPNHGSGYFIALLQKLEISEGVLEI